MSGIESSEKDRSGTDGPFRATWVRDVKVVLHGMCNISLWELEGEE